MAVYLANNPYRSNDIYHHGIKGQRWGIRRFQNPDGSLTNEGKSRYGVQGDRIDSDERGASGSVKRNPVSTMISGIRKVKSFIGDVGETRRKKLIAKNPKKYMNKMTDEELKNAIERINLERRYTESFKQVEPVKRSRAKEFATDFIEKSASKIGMAVVDKFISNIGVDHELADLKRREEMSRLLKSIVANDDTLVSKLERNKNIANLKRDIRIAKDENYDKAYMKMKNSDGDGSKGSSGGEESSKSKKRRKK